MSSQSDSSSPKKPEVIKQGAKKFTRSEQWRVEDDYRDKLSDEDKKFLDRFNQAYAGGDPGVMYKTKKAQRQLYREHSKILRDALTFRDADLVPDPTPVEGTHDDARRELRECVRMNQEDTMIALLDEHACPSGQNLKDRVRARKEAREKAEAVAEARATPKTKRRRRKRAITQ